VLVFSRVHTHTHTNNGAVAFGAAAGGFGVAPRAPAFGCSAFGAAPAVAGGFGHPSTAQSSLQSSSTDSLVDQPTEFYHATNLKAAISIQKEGFRVDLCKRQLLGPGMYCTTKLNVLHN